MEYSEIQAIRLAYGIVIGVVLFAILLAIFLGKDKDEG